MLVTHTLLSIQYLGSRSPEPVKKKVLELIYSWTLALPDEAKISDAYQMLKKQGERLCLSDKWKIYLLKLFEGSRDFNPCYNKARKNYKNNELNSWSVFTGIIKQDPELPPDKLLNLPPPRPKNAIFEDEEKSKVRTV